MKACENCGAVRARRKCHNCGRMVCSRCAGWWGSSRSIEHGPVTAQCIEDCVEMTPKSPDAVLAGK